QQRSLELAQELARQNKIRVEAGQIPPLDLVQAEAEVAQRRENLIRANTLAGDAEDRLRRLIADPSDASVWTTRIDPGEEPTGRGALPDVDAAGRAPSASGTTSPGQDASSKTRRPPSSSSATRSCRTCASRRPIAAAILAAR